VLNRLYLLVTLFQIRVDQEFAIKECPVITLHKKCHVSLVSWIIQFY